MTDDTIGRVLGQRLQPGPLLVRDKATGAVVHRTTIDEAGRLAEPYTLQGGGTYTLEFPGSTMDLHAYHDRPMRGIT